MAVGPTTELARAFRVSWSGTDDVDAQSFDVRYRQAKWNGALGSYAIWKSAVSASSATFTGKWGTEYCLSVRARDAAGNVSDWSSEQCTALPLDDRSRASSGGWSRVTGKRYMNGTATTTSKRGRMLTRTNAPAGRAEIVVATGPHNGAIAVSYNGRVVRNISLSTPKSHERVVIGLPRLTKHARIDIRTTRAARTTIDGILLART